MATPFVQGRAGMKTTSARIIIVDDHPIVRHGLAQLIQTEPGLEVCGEAAEAGEADEAVAGLGAGHLRSAQLVQNRLEAAGRARVAEHRV